MTIKEKLGNEFALKTDLPFDEVHDSAVMGFQAGWDAAFDYLIACLRRGDITIDLHADIMDTYKGIDEQISVLRNLDFIN